MHFQTSVSSRILFTIGIVDDVLDEELLRVVVDILGFFSVVFIVIWLMTLVSWLKFTAMLRWSHLPCDERLTVMVVSLWPVIGENINHFMRTAIHYVNRTPHEEETR